MRYDRKRYLTDKLEDLVYSRRQQIDRHPVPGDYHGLRLRDEIAALEWALSLARENERLREDAKYG